MHRIWVKNNLNLELDLNIFFKALQIKHHLLMQVWSFIQKKILKSRNISKQLIVYMLVLSLEHLRWNCWRENGESGPVATVAGRSNGETSWDI